jgi:Asparagine synthase/Glutamine amidotransferase domain
MYGLVAGFGSAASRVSPSVLPAAIDDDGDAKVGHFTDERSVSVMVMVPRESHLAPLLAWRRDGRLGIAVDGYLTTDVAGPPGRQVERLLQMIEERGVESALGAVVAGAFNLVVIDLDARTFVVANDRLGPIPLYVAETRGGAVVSTLPRLPVTTGLVSREPDLTACAELIYLGNTIGDRYYLKGLRRLPRASILKWEEGSGRLEARQTSLAHLPDVAATAPADLDAIAETVRASCRRMADVSGRTALFLSGGMDSRLILAAWPAGRDLPCYSYGPAEFADVAIARQLAATRGAPFTRVPLDGNQVADDIDRMLCFTGPPAFPNRYLAARRVLQDGFDTVLDGYMGDVLLGGSFYGKGPVTSRLARYARYVNRLVDEPTRRIGLDRLAEWIFADMLDPGALAWLERNGDPDFARALAAERPRILEDISTELRRMASPDGSTALLFRNFTIVHKALHNSIFQTVASRRFVRVGVPLMNDGPFLEATLRLPPDEVAFRKLYIRLFRRHFPAYADAPYAASLLPLRRSPLLHHWVRSLGSRRNRLIPHARALAVGFDEWRTWLAQSEGLRERAVVLLARLGVASAERLRAAVERIGDGRESGSGDLLHLGGLAYLVQTPLRLGAAGPR